VLIPAAGEFQVCRDCAGGVANIERSAEAAVQYGPGIESVIVSARRVRHRQVPASPRNTTSARESLMVSQSLS